MLVDGIRMIASQHNLVIPASFLGKLKTFIFSFAIGIMFFVLPAIVKKNIYNNT
jgi:phosphatidylglycerophosphate synthase